MSLFWAFHGEGQPLLLALWDPFHGISWNKLCVIRESFRRTVLALAPPVHVKPHSQYVLAHSVTSEKSVESAGPLNTFGNLAAASGAWFLAEVLESKSSGLNSWARAWWQEHSGLRVCFKVWVHK